MAAPILRGRALAKQRVVGVVFLVVIAALVAGTIGLYQKAFTSTVDVELRADRAGNQLGKGGDVKARGVVVGEITDVEAGPDGATISLALKPDKVDLVPADTKARLLPKTLFGEKFVSLEFDSDSAAPPLSDGDVIEQDQSETAREFATALDNLLPLLQTLKPEQVSTTLNALSTTLRGRGERIGNNMSLAGDYLAEFNPELPRLAENFRGIADFADTINASTDDIVQVLDNFSAINRSLVETEGSLEGFLRTTTGFAGTSEGFLAENEQRFITLARESAINLPVYEKFAPQYPCMSASLVEDHEVIADSFGNLQPGLHITLEFIKQREGYVPGDEPEYLDDGGFTCRSLGTSGRERPIPEYRDGEDGYRDGQGVNPSTGERDGPPPAGPEGPYTYPDQRRQGPDGAPGGPDRNTFAEQSATPFSPASYDKAAVGVVVAPAYGVQPEEVPDIAVLLFGPVARDTVVAVA